MTTKPVLELRHVECEPAANFAPRLEEFAALETARVWREPVPRDPTGYSAIVVMGGPMGANDAGTLPWIAEEIDLLRRAVHAGVPVWGVCLGAQLLAAALGAAVYTGPVPEVGVFDITLTAAGRDDPVFGGTAGFPALQWHSDTFDIPSGATLLGSSAAYPNQLFRCGINYGIQFHLEADATLAAEWLQVDQYREALTAAIGLDAVHEFLTAIKETEVRTKELAVQSITRWLTLVQA